MLFLDQQSSVKAFDRDISLCSDPHDLFSIFPFARKQTRENGMSPIDEIVFGVSVRVSECLSCR